jgi:hypothetical protein
LIVDNSQLSIWGDTLKGLGALPMSVGGVSISRVGASETGSAAALLTMRQMFDRDRFESLLVSVHDYLARGGNAKDLTASRAVELGLIPADAVVGPPAPPELNHPEVNWFPAKETRYGMTLYRDDAGRIVISEWAHHASADQLKTKYGRFAYSASFSDSGRVDSEQGRMGVLMMSFDRDQLAAAAAAAIEAGSSAVAVIHGSSSTQ